MAAGHREAYSLEQRGFRKLSRNQTAGLARDRSRLFCSLCSFLLLPFLKRFFLRGVHSKSSACARHRLLLLVCYLKVVSKFLYLASTRFAGCGLSAYIIPIPHSRTLDSRPVYYDSKIGAAFSVIESQRRKVKKRQSKRPRGWLLLLLLRYTSKAEIYTSHTHTILN